MMRMPAKSRGDAAKAPAAARDAGDSALAAYCPDIDEWPSIWRYEARDVAPGRELVACLKPFLRHLLSLDLSRKTLNRHRDNLWLLGSELIRGLHDDAPGTRRRPIRELVLAAVDEEGGPLIRRGTEVEQRSFDATCRRLYRFLQTQDNASRS
jgi:hypothetical protein